MTRWWRSRPVVRQAVLGRSPAGWILLGVVGLAMTLQATGAGPQPPDTQSPPTPPAEASETAPDPPRDGQPEQPVFRSEISYVRVDAIITDRDDNHVLDLTQEEFEIFEDDIRQEIESFQLIQIDGQPDPDLPPPSSIRNDYDQEREAARSDTRMFAFFLDDYHVRDYNAIRLMEPLVEFVETLGPTDMVAVMYPLTPTFDVYFTRDHAQIIRALQGFKGVKYDYEPRNMYEQQYAYYPTTTVEKIRNDVSLSALRGLSIKLGGLREGRKSIIVLTEGYSTYVPPQLRSMSAAGDPLGGQGGPFAGDNRREETSQFFETASMQMDLLHVADVANKNNVSFYTVDARGLAVFEYDMSNRSVGGRTDGRILRDLQNTIHTLAEQTDGRAIVNRNNVAPGLAAILRDTSAYYLLGYTSSEAPTDGKFHEIEVKVNRRGVKVRARPGYYALTEADADRVLAPPKPELPKVFDVALATLAEPIRGRLVRTWVGTRRGDNGKTLVTFVWEPVGTTQSQRRETASQVFLMAMSDSGAYFRGSVPERGSDSPRAEFEADAGTLELDVAIEDEFGDVIDRVPYEVTIPDFTGVDVALSTPAVLRARNALHMRELVADPDALPTASRFFRRTEQLLVRVEAYAPGNAVPVVSGQMLSREGSFMRELPVEQPVTGGPYELTLPLAPFPRGDYLIQISAAAGGDVATTLVAFRIQG